ncbi:MAG: Lrp/AsnC family transcriptional regulator [Gammaproteobacteria bacterium]|nr:Lrp/AsnC family transcriptional regulator [Gammaproteobacteria bacterium]
MVTSIVLINAQHGKINDVAQALAEMPEFTEVYSVGGSYDLVGIMRVANNEDIATLVTEKMNQVNGIEQTETMIAFKTYSQHDLEGLFSIGME